MRKNKYLLIISFLVVLTYNLNGQNKDVNTLIINESYFQTKNIDSSAAIEFSLIDYFGQNKMLNQKVDSIYNNMNDTVRVSQMIVVAAGKIGKSQTYISKLILKKNIGGILLLKDSKEKFILDVKRYDSISKLVGIPPLMYSADAEPSLINNKIMGSEAIRKTNTISNAAACDSTVKKINSILDEVGIQINYAPVCDINFNTAIIGNRSFGKNKEKVIELCSAFIKTSQENNIVATAKHFPGHGSVTGDSHHSLVYIDGEMKELDIFKAAIDSGVISVMVGHIAVINNSKYNTGNNIPSSCSKNIVTELLKNELGFKGVVITDAMTMGALNNIANADFEAVKAGCDIILMPSNENKLICDVIQEMNNDELFKAQIAASVKKIIRLKICLRLIK